MADLLEAEFCRPFDYYSREDERLRPEHLDLGAQYLMMLAFVDHPKNDFGVAIARQPVKFTGTIGEGDEQMIRFDRLDVEMGSEAIVGAASLYSAGGTLMNPDITISGMRPRQGYLLNNIDPDLNGSSFLRELAGV